MSIIDKIFNRSKAPIPNRNFYYGGITPPSMNTEGFLNAYGNVGWLHAVVFRIALGCSEVEWTLFDSTNQDKPKQIFKHPILTLLHQVNPFQTSNEFIALDTIYNELIGESFWALNFNALGEPAEIILPYPHKMSVVPAKNFPFVKGYVYGSGTDAIPFDVNEIIHFKYPNPLNQYRGLAPARAIGINLDAEQNADKWVNQFFYNSARPDGVIQFDYSLSDEQFEKLKKQWQEKYKGVSKSHQVALLEGGGKYLQIQNSIKDMDFANLKQKNRDVILGVFGMPQSVMGISENVNKANAEAGDYTFARWIVKPRLDWKKAKIQEQLIPKFRRSDNLQIGFKEVVPETAEQKRLDAESAIRGGFWSVNEARIATGKAPIPNGDVLLVPLNLIPTPINAPLEQPEKPVEEPEEIEQESYKGGEGSGNFDHEGRPGEVGGSGGGGGGKPSSDKPKPGGDKPSGEKPKPSGGKTGEEWVNSLEDDERGAIHNWQRSEWENMREYQKTGKGDKETKELNDKWTAALDKDGSYDGVVYRGVGDLDEKSMSKLTSADSLTLRADSSSTPDSLIATGFALSHGQSPSEKAVIYKIQSKSGVDISKASHQAYVDQKEVVLRKGTSYKIVGKSKQSYRVWGRSYKITTLELREE